MPDDLPGPPDRDRDTPGDRPPGERPTEPLGGTPPHTYSNLWVVRLDAEGRCTEFTEWWMRHPD